MVVCLDLKGENKTRAIHTIDMNISFDINDNSVFQILLLVNNGDS